MDVESLRGKLVALLKDNLLVKEVVPALYETNIITEEERQKLWHCNILRQQVRDLVDIILTKENYMDKLKEMSKMLKQKTYLEHAFISPHLDKILDDVSFLSGRDENEDTDENDVQVKVQRLRPSSVSKRRTSDCVTSIRRNSNNSTDSGISSIDSGNSLDENTEPASELSEKCLEAVDYFEQGLTNKYEQSLLTLARFRATKVQSEKNLLNILEACIKVVLANVPLTKGMERKLYNNCSFFAKHFQPDLIGPRKACDLYIACALICTKLLHHSSLRSSERYAKKAIKCLERCHRYIARSAESFQLLQWRHCHLCLAKHFLRSNNLNEDALHFERADKHLDNVDLCPLPLDGEFRNEFYRCKADLHYRRHNLNRALQYISQVYDCEDPPKPETHIREVLFKQSLENCIVLKMKRKLIRVKNDELPTNKKRKRIGPQRLGNYVISKFSPTDHDKARAIDLYTNQVKAAHWPKRTKKKQR